MASAAVSQPKIPTKIPQLRLVGDKRAARIGARARSGRSAAQVGGDTRLATRAAGRVVVEVGQGVVVYPARYAGDR
jgi:hypothetical protein